MTDKQKSVFDHLIAEARKDDPSIECPRRMAKEVLERMGVFNMGGKDFEDFVEDLYKNNLQTAL